MKHIKRYFKGMFEDIFLNTQNRLCTQLRLFCIAAAAIAVIMTVLNGMKAEYVLELETGIGAAVSLIIYWHASKTGKYLPGSIGISVIFLTLLSAFLLSGTVEGFATLWFCLYPFICLFILDMRVAVLFILLCFAILAGFFWTPLQQYLPDVYTENFKLRFPLLYVGNFAFAMALNGFYTYTYNRLLYMNRKFERLSNLDGLTRLANRAYLEKYEKEYLNRGEGRLSAVMLDVDYFKQYNDTYGHLAGDEVLKAIAGQILERLPEETGIGVRYGGEEFLVLLPECGAGEAVRFAEKLLNGVYGLHIPHAGVNGYLSVSIGVSSKSAATQEEFRDLLQRADEALYQAKQNGRNRIAVK